MGARIISDKNPISPGLYLFSIAGKGSFFMSESSDVMKAGTMHCYWEVELS